MEHFSTTDWLASLGNVALAVVGGLLGYIMREHDKGNPLNWWRAVLEAMSSGFVGVLVLLLCRAMNVDELWTGFAVGMFGWLGANASIRLLEGLVYRKLGVKLRENTDKRYPKNKDTEA